MWKIYAASETFLLIAETDRVLCHLVMFLPLFLHWIYKMKYGSYQRSFVILGWLDYWVVVEKCAPVKRKSEITIFKNKLLLVSFFTLLDYAKCLNYLMGFRAACRPVGLSNYVAFHVFFFFWFHVYAVILRTLVRLETICLT